MILNEKTYGGRRDGEIWIEGERAGDRESPGPTTGWRELQLLEYLT